MNEFRAYSCRLKGAKHKDDEPCQDAISILPLEDAVIAAVADGHGSEPYFRSDIGSDIAIKVAENTLKQFVENGHINTINPDSFMITLHGLVKQIINNWFVEVMKHELHNPLENDQRINMIPQSLQRYKDRYLCLDSNYGTDYRCHAYGTTLVATVLSDDYWFGFHIGDGKCVVLYEDGSWKFPIPCDNRCVDSATTSICDDDSILAFRYWFGFKENDGGYIEYRYGIDGQGNDNSTPVKTTSRPLSVFIASDGVDESLSGDNYVIDFYRNRIIHLIECGFDAFNEQMDAYAERFSQHRSKDDVSIAGIIGNVEDRADLLEDMKKDSAYFKASWMASEKRRDAYEKENALVVIQRIFDVAMKRGRQLESRISTIEGEITALDTKKKSYESTLLKCKSEIEISDRSIVDFQSKIRGLECSESENMHEEQIISVKITIAYDEEQKGKKVFESMEKEYAKKKKSLRKKQEAYDKYLHKFSSGSPQATIIGQVQKVIGTQTTITAVTYDANGNVINHITAQIPPVNPISIAPAPANTVVIDAKTEGYKQEIERINAEVQTLQEQVITARQNTETKSRGLSALRQQLSETQQRTRNVEAEINHLTQSLRTVETQNRHQCDAVRQLQNDISEAEHNIITKQSELDKQKSELETLKEQNKKQSDTLSTIKAAWEKAESEANALKEIISNQ